MTLGLTGFARFSATKVGIDVAELEVNAYASYTYSHLGDLACQAVWFLGALIFWKYDRQISALICGTVRSLSSPRRRWNLCCRQAPKILCTGLLGCSPPDLPFEINACDFELFKSFLGWHCLQWGRSNLVDPTECSKIGLLNRGFGSVFLFSPRKSSKTQGSLNFLQSGPPKFTKLTFSGLAPIR